MHTLKRAVFFGAAIALFIPAAAAQTLDEIVAKNLEAKGGVERLRRPAACVSRARSRSRA